MGYVIEKYKTLEEAKNKWKEIDMNLCKEKIGTKYNHLTLIYRTESYGRHTNFVCQCDCNEHNYVKVRLDHLRSNHTRSCGCENIKQVTALGKSCAKDITNIKFGKLTAICPTEKKDYSSIIWKCYCECGNTYYASVNDLMSYHTSSCPNCSVRSKGELKIKQLLDENNILYNKEYTFDDCISLFSNYKCRFDFFVNNQYIIEYDGAQHFKYNNNSNFWNTKDNYLKCIKNDAHKMEYCKKHNIPVIRIPYTHLQYICIEDLLLETSKFRVI